MIGSNETSSGFIKYSDLNLYSKNDIIIHYKNVNMFENYIKGVKLNEDNNKVWSQKKCNNWTIGDNNKRIIILGDKNKVLEELQIEIINIIKDKNKRFKWKNGRVKNNAKVDIHFKVIKIIRSSDFMSKESLSVAFPQYNKNNIVDSRKRKISSKDTIIKMNNKKNKDDLDNVIYIVSNI